MQKSRLPLSERQQTVLRALVRAYVGAAAPVGSATLSQTLSVKLSSASIRNTMAELAELGLIEQPHASAGRLPTEQGLRLFVDELMRAHDVVGWERRTIAMQMGELGVDDPLEAASTVLAERTRQLGFAVLPRLDRVALRHVSLIRLSRERVLVVLVSLSGATYQRILNDDRSGAQAELERIEAEFNQRLGGHSLLELRELLEVERERLRGRAAELQHRTLLAAVRALTGEARARGDVLLSSRTPVLEQPEFHDPERVRGLLLAVEAREALLTFLDQVLEQPGVVVTFGGEVGLPELRDCAVVTAPCAAGAESLGLVGVLGPSRMDYPRVVPLVELLSELVAEKMVA